MNTKTILAFLCLIASSQGLQLFCGFNMLYWGLGATTENLYTCEISQMLENGNSTLIESVNGDHLVGKTDNDVHAFVIWIELPIQDFPRNLGKFFPNLKAIQWFPGNLTSISAEALHWFSDLKGLFLYRNKIVSLEADLFKFAPNLQAISFSNNQITNVGENLLANLSKLSYADFSNNPCVNVFANTRETVITLMLLLTNNCPPLITTTSATTVTSTISTTTEKTCDIRCTVNEEIDELGQVIATQSIRIDGLEETNKEFKQTNKELKGRITELEKQVREILAIP